MAQLIGQHCVCQALLREETQWVEQKVVKCKAGPQQCFGWLALEEFLSCVSAEHLASASLHWYNCRESCWGEPCAFCSWCAAHSCLGPSQQGANCRVLQQVLRLVKLHYFIKTYKIIFPDLCWTAINNYTGVFLANQWAFASGHEFLHATHSSLRCSVCPGYLHK